MVENSSCHAHWIIIYQLAIPGSEIEKMAEEKIEIDLNNIPINFWLAVISDDLLLSKLRKILKKKIVAREFSYEEWLELTVTCSEAKEKDLLILLEKFQPIKDR